MTTASMRVLGISTSPLVVLSEEPAPLTTFVQVPGFGVLVVRDTTEGTRAWVYRPPSTDGVERDVRIVEGRVEVDMLHKPDRLTVVLTDRAPA